jgi:hypothetical protein
MRTGKAIKCVRKRRKKVSQVALNTYKEHRDYPISQPSLGPPLWSNRHRSGLDYLYYQIFREVVGLERGPLSLASTIEGLLERKSSGSGPEIRDYDRRDPSR